MNTQSCYVRIDNFVRPLTQKGLVQWLEEKSGNSGVSITIEQPSPLHRLFISLGEKVEDIWVNSIKTHCYVTFSTPAVALACIKAVYGCAWPEGGGSNCGILEADFTTVSAASADSTQEVFCDS